ncbi:MAG: biosynthetic-type acetolactate synthase large subunit [Lachnospiraceae bacterium]
MQLNGAEIIIECLKEQGVDTIFGYPGGAILNVYDELYKHRKEIRHILTSHEQGAAHAADGYARATGKVGVCMATSGPGATNLVTGIATAFMDSVPLVAITANVTTPLLGKDSFQEVDIAGIVTPITKYSFIVKRMEDIAPTIRRAFRIAQNGRPGPVLVDITKDATDLSRTVAYEPETPVSVTHEENTFSDADLELAAKMINQSERPYIFVGGGAVISGAAEQVNEFAHLLDAPVTDSLMGKGAFDGTDALYTGMLGMHGTKTANFGVTECDLLVVIGARFSDRVTGNTKTFAKNAKIIHIDIDAAEINKNVRVDARLVGDAKDVLTGLMPLIQKRDRGEWAAHIQKLKETYPMSYRKDVLTGPFVIEELYRLTEGKATIVTDVGQHQMWAAQYYKFSKPRQLLTSGGLGTMGYGLGAAIGAKTARPDALVVNIAGDGCFRMNMNELATAVRENIPIIQIVLNNHVLGMVRQWQTLFYGQRYSNTILQDQMDFVKVSEGMGAKAFRVTKKEEFAPVFEQAVSLGVPAVIECWIDSDDKVFPMVSPGAPIAEAFDETDLTQRSGE